MNAPTELARVLASQPDPTLGYRTFTLGSFSFARDEYFARHFPQRRYPPNTLLIVRGLVRADLLVEIDATAYRRGE